jgi:hypothetical protein
MLVMELVTPLLFPQVLNQTPSTFEIKETLRTGMDIDSRVDCADLVLSGLVCATAKVEPSVVLVLESSNRRDKR